MNDPTYSIGDKVLIVAAKTPGIIRSYVVHTSGITYNVEYWYMGDVADYAGDRNTVKKLKEEEWNKLVEGQYKNEHSLFDE